MTLGKPAIANRGSGWRACPDRGRHWGPDGAAGVLPWTAWAGRVAVLLGKRSPYVQDPGYWSTFGGAIEPGENPADAALRELAEEVRGVTAALPANPAYTGMCRACGWSYATYLGCVPPGSTGRLRAVWVRSNETIAARWVLLDEVPQLSLHPGLAEAWPVLCAQVAAAAKQGKERP